MTGWVAPGDGMLMLDRNVNGTLDNGAELFGDFTPLPNGMLAANGFAALAPFDTNGDGKIDASDPIWSQLRIWQFDDSLDTGDISDPSVYGKIGTLDDFGITAIYLDSTITNRTDSDGNTEVRTGHFERADGSSNIIAEYRFQRDTTYTISNEWLDVPPEIEVLPDLQGYGNVYDLHQAMAREQQAIGDGQEAIGNKIFRLAA